MAPCLPPPPADYGTRLPPQQEATELVALGPDAFGRELRLAPAAASAWCAMRDAASADGVVLLAISGFRSVARQREILVRKLAQGISWAEILCVNAYPGHSEHHTGRAIDIGTPGCVHLSEAFEATGAFRWLQRHAATHGFALSYPKDGLTGIIYEPWHWCWLGSVR